VVDVVALLLLPDR